MLEVGCGPGSLLGPLSGAGYVHFGVDLSMAMIARFSERSAGLGLPSRGACADAEALPFPDRSFDLVVAVGLLEYLPSASGFLAEAARVLRKGGRLLLSVPSAVSPHALAAGAFRRLPRWIRAGLLGRDREFHTVRSRPVRLGRLRADLRRSGFESRRWCFSQFVFFPLDLACSRRSSNQSVVEEIIKGIADKTV